MLGMAATARLPRGGDRCLLVIDDVCKHGDLALFLRRGPKGADDAADHYARRGCAASRTWE